MYKNMKQLKTIPLLLLLLMPLVCSAQKGAKHAITISVSDKDSKESIIMATVQLQPTGAIAVTDANGNATIRNVEAGNYQVSISYVGYEPINTRIKVNGNLKLDFKMAPTTLALKEVSVTAQHKVSGASASSLISRQANDETMETVLALDGVEDVNVNAKRHTLAYTFFNDETTAERLIGEIRQAGIKAQEPKPHECKEEKQ